MLAIGNVEFIIIGVMALVLIILAVILIVVNRNKKGKVKIDTDFIDKLVNLLGKKRNILDVKNDSGRVKFVLEDLELANLEEIRTLSTAGIFITNNTIKMLFSYDSDLIVKLIKQYKED